MTDCFLGIPVSPRTLEAGMMQHNVESCVSASMISSKTLRINSLHLWALYSFRQLFDLIDFSSVQMLTHSVHLYYEIYIFLLDMPIKIIDLACCDTVSLTIFLKHHPQGAQDNIHCRTKGCTDGNLLLLDHLNDHLRRRIVIN